MSVLSFDLDLKLINTVSLNIGELEDNDLPLSLAADKANVIKILYRKEVKGSVRKVLKKFFKYTIFEIDQNSKVDSTEVFKDLKYNKSYINWVWDASRNTCFLSSYVAGDDNDMQTGARFEKYNSKVKNVVLRDYNFNNDFMQKFREKPVNLPYLSYFCFDGLHLASNGDLFAVGEFYDDNYYKAPLRKETIKMKYAEGQKNRNLTGGPFMIFKLKNTLEIEWVKEFDKYFNEGLFAGAWSSDFEFIKRDQVNFFSNGKLKLFFYR